MQENVFERVFGEMAAILSRPQCINSLPGDANMPIIGLCNHHLSPTRLRDIPSDICNDFIWSHKIIQNHHYDGLVQERHNSSTGAMELRLSCTDPSISQWN